MRGEPRKGAAGRHHRHRQRHRLPPPTAAAAYLSPLAVAAAVVVFIIALAADVIAADTSALRRIMKRDEDYQPFIAKDFPHLLGKERLFEWMNKTEDPCYDFYNYACGGE